MKSNVLKLWCLALVVAMTFFTACGTKNDDGSKTPHGEQEGGNGQETSIELNFMHFNVKESSEGGTLAFYDAMEMFKDNNPNIEIEEEILGHDAYETKIKTLAAANEMPDLFVIKGSMVSAFVESGLINPVNDILEQAPAWKDGFMDGVFNDFKMGDNIYALPYSNKSTHIIYYNEHIFEECGITSFPASWEGFKDAVGKIRDKGYTPIALGNKGKWVVGSCILSTLGDRFTGTDWFMSIKDRKGAKFTEPEFVDALAAVQELAVMGAFNADMNSIDNMQHKTLYYGGKAAMFFEGAWAISSISEDAPQEIADVTKLAILPAVEGGKGDAKAVSAGAGWGYNMNAELQGEKKQAAVEVFKALTDEKQAKISMEYNAMPASNPGEYDESKLTPLFKQYADIMAEAKSVPVYDVQLEPAVIEVMNSGLQELLIQATTPEELAKKIQKEYE